MSKCEKATYEDSLTNSHTVFNSLSHMTKQTDRIVSARKVLDFFGGEQSNSFFKAAWASCEIHFKKEHSH